MGLRCCTYCCGVMSKRLQEPQPGWHAIYIACSFARVQCAPSTATIMRFPLNVATHLSSKLSLFDILQ